MKNKNDMRRKRKLSIRRKIRGTGDRPRLAVYRSNRRFSAQIIDDEKAVTLLSAWTSGKNIKAAVDLGAKVADLAKSRKITTVVFDRSGYRYHGAVKAFAEGVRSGGLVF